MNFKKKIYNYLNCGYPLIAIRTTEHERVLEELKQVITEKIGDKTLYLWDFNNGLRKFDQAKSSDTNDIAHALDSRHENAVIIFEDINNLLIHVSPKLIASIKDFCQFAATVGTTGIFIGADFNFSPTYQKYISILDYSLPNSKDLKKILNNAIKSICGSKKIGLSEKEKKRLEKDIKEDSLKIVRAMSGLSTVEATNALYLSFFESKFIDPKVIYREKITTIKQHGLLDFIEPDERGIEAVGGLNQLKEFILNRRCIFSKNATAYRLPRIKGVIIAGIPGSGKSVAAKMVGSIYEIPTVRLDMGKLFGSLVGQSEQRMRETIDLAEAVAPTILWIDEIEKGFAGSAGRGTNDNGVAKRILGTFLNWMQETEKDVIVIATANDIECLPPELIRRFDEVFAVTLPTPIEREEIFKIHLLNKKRNPDNYAIKELVKASKKFTGHEIEKSINAAMFVAFTDNEREFNTSDIVNAIRNTRPIAETMKEQIDYIEENINKRFKRASDAEGKSIKNSDGLRVV